MCLVLPFRCVFISPGRGAGASGLGNPVYGVGGCVGFILFRVRFCYISNTHFLTTSSAYPSSSSIPIPIIISIPSYDFHIFHSTNCSTGCFVLSTLLPVPCKAFLHRITKLAICCFRGSKPVNLEPRL